MSQLNTQQNLIEGYKILNAIKIQTELVILAIARWSAVLLFGTEFFLWQTQNTVPSLIKAGVLSISLLIMGVLTSLLFKKNYAAEIIVGRLNLIERELEFGAFESIHKDADEKKWSAVHGGGCAILNLVYLAVLFVHLCLLFMIKILQ